MITRRKRVLTEESLKRFVNHNKIPQAHHRHHCDICGRYIFGNGKWKTHKQVEREKGLRI